MEMMKSNGSRSSTPSPCAACKFLKRRCIPNCIFAPHFRADASQKFANVHKIFGASNVGKLLSEIQPELREDAANSLAYEAEARIRDPVFGCVAHISLLQWKMLHLQHHLANARTRLARYTTTTSTNPNPNPPPPLIVLPSSSSSSSNINIPLISYHDYTDIDIVAQLASPEQLMATPSESTNHLPN